MARHRCDISSKEAELPGHNDKDNTASSLQEQTRYMLRHNTASTIKDFDLKDL